MNFFDIFLTFFWLHEHELEYQILEV
jgi:hypothetical protein